MPKAADTRLSANGAKDGIWIDIYLKGRETARGSYRRLSLCSALDKGRIRLPGSISMPSIYVVVEGYLCCAKMNSKSPEPSNSTERLLVAMFTAGNSSGKVSDNFCRHNEPSMERSPLVSSWKFLLRFFTFARSSRRFIAVEGRTSKLI